MSYKILCVGGVSDGQYVEDSGNIVTHRQMKDKQSINWDSNMGTETNIEYERHTTYSKETYTFDDKKYQVYLVLGINPSALFELLLERYGATNG